MKKLIESSQNRIIKQINSLKAKKERDKTGLFVLEGERLVSEIPPDWQIEYVVVCEDYNGSIENYDNVYIVKKDIFNKISDTVNPQGILAVCRILHRDIDCAFEDKNGLYVILDRIMDPGNMGTIIRTADAGGVSGIFLSKGCVDLYNPKVIRSTMGSIFHLPIYVDVDIEELLNKCRENNITTVATHLKGDKMPYEIDMKKSCAILIGNEANGLPDEVSNRADKLVKIPMPGKAESMNAAIAGSILIYEAVRQRI